MATKRYTGNAPAVAQVASATVDSVDGTPANNTFTVTIGGVAISTPGNTSANQTAADLVALLNASTHPYFAAVTWAAPGSGAITGTADEAGVPFLAALTETGAGTGAVTDFADTTAAAGPSVLDTAANWSDGAVPANGDTVIIANSDVNIAYNLGALSGVGLAALIIEQTYRGLLGLPVATFASGGDGGTADTDATEYRATYLEIGADRVEIGDHNAVTVPVGAKRLKLHNNEAGASTTIIHNTAAVGADLALPAVRLLYEHASATLEVRKALGGVGIAVDFSSETATLGTIVCADVEGGSRVFVGEGVTVTNFTAQGGAHVLRSAAAVTAVEVEGGELELRGDQAVTTLTLNGGTVYASNAPAAGSAIGTVNLNGGTLSGLRATAARTWATVNHQGGALERDSSHVTITTYNPPTGRDRIEARAA